MRTVDSGWLKIADRVCCVDFANGSVIPEASAVARHQSEGRLTIVEKGMDGIHPMDVIFKLMRAARAVDASVTSSDAKGEEVVMWLLKFFSMFMKEVKIPDKM